jgi:glycosyltransferase involved in cell wall biosynthesis
MFDRASADVRMFAIVRLLREQGHDCQYYVSNINTSESRIGTKEVSRYRDALRQMGVTTLERTSFEHVLAEQAYDLVFFKYFYPAEARLPLVRIWQPRARVVVDSVDLVYARLQAKAEVSGLAADRSEAAEIKARELATYAAADMVITVTEDEARILASELPGVPIHIIPNIHDAPATTRSETSFPSLLFIGTFTHEPNVDGMLWFAREIWPGLRSKHLDIQLRVVGGNPPPAIQALDGDGMEILGYVPDTLSYLMDSWLSVAPLRFGAGMKGKVGEAMAAGLPVVTTSFGAEGFGLVPGEHLFVADDPVTFSESISKLIDDPNLRAQLGKAGQAFIDSRYSPRAVNQQLRSLTQRLEAIAPRQIAFARLRRLGEQIKLWVERNLLWRLRNEAAN